VSKLPFHAFGRYYIKLDQLKLALEVIGHEALLQPKIGIFGCFIYVIEQTNASFSKSRP
jgi:hypothetical protein